MERGSWKRPVLLEMFGRPGVTTVGDTLEAALVLLGAWPHKRTPAHMAAVTSCRDVLAGRAEPALARVDFIEAALEAGFHVETETFFATPQPLSDTGAGSESGQRHLPSILSFVRASTSPSSTDPAHNGPQGHVAAGPQSAMAAVAPPPRRWPPPAWASIALDHEIAEQEQHDVTFQVAEAEPYAAHATVPVEARSAITMPAPAAEPHALPTLTTTAAQTISDMSARAHHHRASLPAFDFDEEPANARVLDSRSDAAAIPPNAQVVAGPHRPTFHPIGHSLDQSLGQSLGQSVSQSLGQSVHHTLKQPFEPSLRPPLPRAAHTIVDGGRKRRTIAWSALPAPSAPQSDSPGFGELMLRLFDTLGMIGLVSLQLVAGMLNLHLTILHRRHPQAPAKSH